MKWCFIGQNSLSFNLRVSKNRSLKHSLWIMKIVSYRETLPTNPNCLPLIRKGLIRHVT
jgi:hypothetical protein